jgi:hypothetical protein
VLRAQPLLAQPQVFDLELVDAEHDVVVLVDDGLLEQGELPRLYQRHRGQHQRQHQAGQPEQRQAAAARRRRLYCTSSVFSCHADRP